MRCEVGGVRCGVFHLKQHSRGVRCTLLKGFPGSEVEVAWTIVSSCGTGAVVVMVVVVVEEEEEEKEEEEDEEEDEEEEEEQVVVVVAATATVITTASTCDFVHDEVPAQERRLIHKIGVFFWGGWGYPAISHPSPFCSSS